MGRPLKRSDEPCFVSHTRSGREEVNVGTKRRGLLSDERIAVSYVDGTFNGSIQTKKKERDD